MDDKHGTETDQKLRELFEPLRETKVGTSDPSLDAEVVAGLERLESRSATPRPFVRMFVDLLAQATNLLTGLLSRSSKRPSSLAQAESLSHPGREKDAKADERPSTEDL